MGSVCASVLLLISVVENMVSTPAPESLPEGNKKLIKTQLIYLKVKLKINYYEMMYSIILCIFVTLLLSTFWISHTGINEDQ